MPKAMERTKGLFKNLATRTVIAAIPVAMVGAYAVNTDVPTPPRMAAYEYTQVAEITVAPSTVGLADSNLYALSNAEIDFQLQQMSELGVKNIRVFVPWALVETMGPTEPGSAAWAKIDYILKAAEARDMGVLAEVNSTPVWANADGSTGTGPFPGAAAPDVQKFKNFMVKFATQYKDIVSAYEVWNEPNGVNFYNPISPESYAELLKAVYPDLKNIDPTATVVAGALAHVQSAGALTLDPVTFVQRMYAAGAQGFFDALSVHPYQKDILFSQGSGFSFTALGQIQAIQALMATKGDYMVGPDGQPLKDANGNLITKKVWITEYGLSTTGTATGAKQEQFIKDLITYWKNVPWAGPIFLYSTRDIATGSTDINKNYGLWTTGWIAKPIVDWLKTYFVNNPNQTHENPPPGPTPEEIAQALAQAVAKALADAVAKALQQAVAKALAEAVAKALAQALANWAASLKPVAPVVTPAAIQVAPAEAVDAVETTEAVPAASSGTEAAEGAPEAPAKTGASADEPAEGGSAPDVAVGSGTAVEPVAEPVVEPVAEPVVEPVAEAPPVVADPVGTPAPSAEPAPESTPPAGSTDTVTTGTPDKDAGAEPEAKPDKAAGKEERPEGKRAHVGKRPRVYRSASTVPVKAAPSVAGASTGAASAGDGNSGT